LAGEGLHAQLEWYVSGQFSNSLAAVPTQSSAGEIYRDGKMLGLSAETLVGSGQLVPTLGLGFERFGFAAPTDGAERPGYSRLVLPFGVAHRLRAPETSFNLITSLVLQPTYTFGVVGIDGELGPKEVQWHAKVGTRLTLDPIFFGVHFHPTFGDNWNTSPSELSYWTFSIGARW
jgi:hypothetical protein